MAQLQIQQQLELQKAGYVAQRELEQIKFEELKLIDESIAKAESMFSGMKSSGNIAKDKATVAKKTGVWPNGNTN
mgnify:CR=1 FL=1